MKILHIVPSYYPAYSHGGPIASVHSLNKGLVREGVDVTVYTTNINGPIRLSDVPLGRENDVDGVKVWYFPITFSPWEYSISMHRALKKHLKEFDLVHITSVFLAASVLGVHYAKKYRKPYIISPRGSLMKEPLRKKNSLLKKIYIALVEKKNLAGATAIHFTARNEEKEYHEAGLPIAKSFVIPNGLDTEEMNRAIPEGMFRKNFGISPEKKIVLSLGRLNWKKGFDTLIPVFCEVTKKEPNAVLVIAGGDEGGYKKTIEKFIAENGLAVGKNVIFTGELLGDLKLAAFKDSNVFVLPSYSENFGMAPVEAMALKVPVIVSSGTAVAHFIKKENAGIVFDKNDTGAWAKKILWLFDNPEEAKKMAVREKKMVEEEFSIEKVTKMMLAEYNRILKND